MKKQMLYRKHKHDINSDNTEQQVNCYDNEIHSHTVSDIVSQKENKNALNLKTQYNEYIQHQYKISELFGGSNDNTNNNSKHIQITRNNNNNRQNKKKGIFTLSPPKEKVHKKDRILLSNLLLSSQRLFSNNYSSQTSIEKEQIFQRNLFKTQHSSVNSNEHILQHHQPIQNRTQNEFNVVDNNNNDNDKEIHIEKKTLRLKTLEADIKKIKKQEKRNIVPLLPKMPTLHSKDEERLKPKFKFSQTNQKWFYEKRNSSCDTEKNKLGKNNNNQQHILLIEKNEIEEDNNNDNDENMSNNIRKKNIIEVEQQKNEKEEEVITENNKDKKEKKKGKNTSRKKSVDHIKIDYSDKDRETIEQDITERNVFKVKDRKIILTTFGYKDDNNHNNKIHNHKSAQNKKHKKINSFQKFQIFKFNSTNKFPLKPETITYNSKQIDCPEEQHFVNVNSIKIKRMAFL